MEYQTITELIEALKMAGKVYNDADFARKTGLKQSFVSEMKSGKKPFTGATRKSSVHVDGRGLVIDLPTK